MLPTVAYLPALVAGRLVHHVPPGLHLGSAAVLIFIALMAGGFLLSAAIRVRHGRWLIAVAGAAVVAGLGIAGWRAAAGGLGHDHAAWIAGAVAAAGLLVIGARVLAGRVIHGRRRARWLTSGRRLRWHLPPGPGFASGWVLWRRHGLPAARRVARHARPSLSWLGLHLPGAWREYAAFGGWAPGLLHRWRVYSPLESVRLTIAAPQEGKSAAAAGTILDAPGPVVATSIRGDLLAATAGLRARRGQVHIWNPEGAGDVGSTVAWNLVEGCQDMVVAVRRAGYMVEAVTAQGLSDDGFWRDQSSMVLAAYLHAAALAGGTLHDVHRWVLELDPAPVRILSGHPGAAAQARSQAIQYRDMPSRTRSGISATINGTLRFMQHPAVVSQLDPAPGEGFDFEAFLAGPNTLYLVASDAAVSPVSPLFTAILAELTTVARQLGAASSAGRLDPPLSLVLDEVANIAPVPAAQWATWAAGSGIWMHLYAQAWAKLAERWGEHGAAVLWQAAKAKLIYSATSEPELCQMVEDLCGTVRVRGPDEWRYTRTGRPRRRAAYEDVLVLPQAELRQLPAGHAVVIQGSAPPVIVRPENYWRRADVKRWRRHSGPLTLPGPEPRVIPVPMPGLLAPAEQVPASPAPPGAERAPGRPPAAARPAAPHWTAGLPEIPRELFQPPAPAEPDPPARPRKAPRPPSEPAPWDPPSDSGSGT